MKRRCGWLGLDVGEDRNTPLIWVSRQIALRTCPKSYITAESQTLVEEFFVRRRLGGMNFHELTAKQVEAFVILEKALAKEMNDGQHHTREAV